jgi:hypothetical protein
MAVKAVSYTETFSAPYCATASLSVSPMVPTWTLKRVNYEMQEIKNSVEKRSCVG